MWALAFALVVSLIVQSWQIRAGSTESAALVTANNQQAQVLGELKAAVDQLVLINGALSKEPIHVP